MKKSIFSLMLIGSLVVSAAVRGAANKPGNMTPDVLKDKIAGGWAGKMIGVTYGAPTEFQALSATFEKPINWQPTDIKGSMWQDDIYVQLTFLMTMDKYGVNAPAKIYQEMFAKAGYPLWHANMQARKNYFDSIFPPQSGSPEFNMHADDIDFQIESDYLGFMCPGMPRTASKLADKVGHIMNYGDGVYGGIFVAALYSEAFFESDIPTIIEKALRSIPEKSDYAKVVRDVLLLHKHYPTDWRTAWKELESKWGDVDICGAGTGFNIDAKLNGAYIVMGLIYGEGDPLKTMEIATRCGQDSDCNPSNAMAVLGVIKGFNGLPPEMQKGVNEVGDSLFIHTSYSFHSAVSSTYTYALDMIRQNRGTCTDKLISVKIQQAAPPRLEVSFPNLVFDKSLAVADKSGFTFKGDWKEEKSPEGTIRVMYSEKKGDEAVINFVGTGISLEGNWCRNGGKADLYVDGKFHRSIDTYYFFAGQEHTTSIWNILNLRPGNHSVRLVVKGDKREEATGAVISLTKAIIFKSAAKKNNDYRFSFQK